MSRHSTHYSGRVVRRAFQPLLLCVGISLAALGLSHAAQPGHGRVSSLAGSPLQVTVPIRGLTADDLKVLTASIADSASWAQAGLTLPAPLETLSLQLEPGSDASSRLLVLRSTQAVNRPVIDVLIRLTTASGTRTIQSSYLVLTSDASSGSANAVKVVRGDTLYAIALSKAVTGADIYQVMWAIYEANPQAFISENMNLMRAGVTLNIPDAATIRAVDAKYARAMFSKHDQAFRARRGTGQVAATATPVVTAAAQTGTITTPIAPIATPATVGDQVRLDSTNPADQQADQLVAAQNELREKQARLEALEKNLEDLKEALAKSQAIAAEKQSARSSSAQTNVFGVPGAPGAATGSATAAADSTVTPGTQDGASLNSAGATRSVSDAGSSGSTASGSNASATAGALSRADAAGMAAASGAATAAAGSTATQVGQDAASLNSAGATRSGTDAGASSTTASGSSAGGTAGALSTADAAGTGAANGSPTAAAGSTVTPSAQDAASLNLAGATRSVPDAGSADATASGSGGSSAGGTAGALSTADAAGTGAATATPTGAAASATEARAANEVKTSFTKLKDYASDHVLGFVLGISALLALLIAFLLRRAGRQEQAEVLDGAPQVNPALASEFDQKLQSIDLNLSNDDKTASNPSDPPKTGV